MTKKMTVKKVVSLYPGSFHAPSPNVKSWLCAFAGVCVGGGVGVCHWNLLAVGIIVIIKTSRSAIADKRRCMVGKLWQKYKWKMNCAF